MVNGAMEVVGSAGVAMAALLVRVVIAAVVFALIAIPIIASVYGWSALVAAWHRVRGGQRVGHLQWQRGTYYTPGHLWLRPAPGDRLRVGLDDVAQRVLPDIAAVDLVAEGTVVRRGDALGRIRCEDETIVELRSPVDGTVDIVNTRVTSAPILVHREPYRRGWLVDVRPANGDYRRFKVDDAARAWLNDENHRLTHFFEQELGIAAADGGELVMPPHKLLTAKQWTAVRREFLTATSDALDS